MVIEYIRYRVAGDRSDEFERALLDDAGTDS